MKILATSPVIGAMALFLGAVASLLLGPSVLAATPKKSPVPRRSQTPAPADDRETELWLQALTFLDDERDQVGLQTLRARILKERLDRLPIIRQLVDLEVRKRDRIGLRNLVVELAKRGQCSSVPPQPPATGGAPLSTRSPLCIWLQSSWKGHLDSLFFYETTAGRMEKARRALEKGDCVGAIGILREVESREGANRLILEQLTKGYECLGDVPMVQSLSENLRQIEIF